MLGKAPDPPMAELAAALAEGTHHIADAFAALGDGGGTAATAAADAALESQRRVERAYRAGMLGLAELADLHEVAARRELYRRLAAHERRPGGRRRAGLVLGPQGELRRNIEKLGSDPEFFAPGELGRNIGV